MTKARTLADFISDGSEFADGTISVAEVSGAAPLASPTFTGTVTTDELDLNAIAATISDTAVDIFVYDTRKDSDGGAWRKRTQHTSWYNETLNTSTRGSRKEFPAVAVIVAESNQVTIYDGDDPDLPMWMVFSGGIVAYLPAATAVQMINGKLCVSGTNGLMDWDFLLDQMRFYQAGSSRTQLNISTRGSSSLVANGFTAYLVNTTVNDVAMTVLPNAPIDAATGLPVPTIAVATDGGVSVIKDDGTVVDGSVTSVGFDNIGFIGDALYVARKSHMNFYVYSSFASDGFAHDYIANSNYTAGDAVAIMQQSATDIEATASSSDTIYIGADNGEGLKVALKEADNTLDNVTYITSTYNTGWMNGDIKLATLSDTDATNVTGSELVTNGTFDTDVTGWSNGAGAYTTFAWDAGTIAITASGGTARVDQGFSVTAGKTYTFTVTCTQKVQNSHSFVHLGTSVGASNIINNLTQTEAAGVPVSYTFTATTSSVYIQLGAVSGTTVNYDNVSVRLAEEDRSVNGNGLQVFGTVTKSAVATGADLVAYSGFATSGNYLKQPYNSDLDLGTNDFSIISWIKQSAYTNTYSDIIDKAQVGSSTGRLEFYFYQDDLTLRIGGTSTFASTVAVNNVWLCVAAVRRNGVVYLYVNGEEKASGTNAGTVTNTNGDGTFIGVNYNGDNGGQSKELALLRFSATAPSPEQIKKIYEDEKVLFQDGAQATLYGSSDAVTALAYDDSTNILSVGTSAGRSDFQGLRRVNNTTNAVGAAISASNGMIVEE